MKTVRCAIYTRKSSEEGLEQDFSSLDAQREACAAYVLSQASEGWKLRPDLYDDGGLSGGSLERPALQRLLGDVKAGQIDIIVVYKVDRLTRSLLDFAKLVEAFDEAHVSFVSVTQSFNTTTSMGRLTLNMLLSFAQFEREVTAERIRDKIAASKAKGMWMGGIPPLGYRPDGRSLQIIPDHARIVEDIYRLYREKGNVRRVAEHLIKEGVRSPIRTTSTCKTYGGGAFSRGQLYSILKNPIYAGKIAHKQAVYPGNHSPIICEEEWEAVQRQLSANTQGVRRAREQSCALLAGLVFDDKGNALKHVHATKGSKRYRYYVGGPQEETAGKPLSPLLRIPALEIERFVRTELHALLSDPLALAAKANSAVSPSSIAAAKANLDKYLSATGQANRSAIRQLVVRVAIFTGRVVLSLHRPAICELLGVTADGDDPATLDHPISARIKRSGMAVRLISSNGARAIEHQPDATLIRLVVQSRTWWARLANGNIDVATLAREEGVSASWMTRVVRLAFLAPEVVEAILAGETKAGICAKDLLASSVVPSDWKDQAKRIVAGA